ncbi:MAG TPA: RnfH family protein [Woeseiaceae bacterium]|jgi:putative ubiquitin-RnfH superfamily antitoxin RatB of RatAB toxin-antitoxin module|nr:RnfH family protein [Woeseiaceae bacterium]
MQERAGDAVRVEVVFALPERQELIALTVEEGATVDDVIRRSGIAGRFPGHDLEQAPVGIWGRVVERAERVRDGDRVEIYRPLAKDPRVARRERARKT